MRGQWTDSLTSDVPKSGLTICVRITIAAQAGSTRTRGVSRYLHVSMRIVSNVNSVGAGQRQTANRV